MTVRLASACAATLLGLAALLPAADQVELHLRTGAVVKGELVSEDADKVVVKSTTMAKSGKAMTMTMSYRRDDIAQVVPLEDPEDVFKAKRLAARSGADHAALAAWCREQGMTDRAVEHAERAVALDATQDGAVKLLADLGWVKDADGKWAKEADVLAAEGKVRYQGKVMTIAEADALKAQAAKQAAAQDAQKGAEEKSNAVAFYDRLLADLKKRAPLLDTELAKANADLATAQGQAQKVAAAKSSVDAAQKALDQARLTNQNAPSGGAGGYAGGGGTNGNTSLTSYTQAVENAQKALIAARKDAATAEAEIPRIKGRIATLTDEKKNLARKQDELTAKRDAAIKAQEQAKAAAGDAAKAADAPAPKPADAAKPADAPAKPAP
jgi:hypothetical protein